MADCFVVLDHLLGTFVDRNIKLLVQHEFFRLLRVHPWIFIDVVMIPRPWPRLLPIFKAWLLSTRSFCFNIEGISTYGETLIVCPCWFIAIERYWNFKLYCITFFPKSALLNSGWGLSTDAAYTWTFTVPGTNSMNGENGSWIQDLQISRPGP